MSSFRDDSYVFTERYTEVPDPTWTSCQVHGHLFRDSEGNEIDHCSDCGEPNAY